MFQRVEGGKGFCYLTSQSNQGYAVRTGKLAFSFMSVHMDISVITGDLVFLAQQGKFDAITHSCNCFCRMKRGIAPQLAKAFGCDKFKLEQVFCGSIKKLGNIDFVKINGVFIINSYMQYHWKEPSRYGIPFDYDACRLCLRKINKEFAGSHIGMPWIGCGLAGGEKPVVAKIIEEELVKCCVTIVERG